MAKIITAAELREHSKPGDMWMAVDSHVYDVSRFARLHPGGAKVLEQLAGNDVTTEFFELHRHEVLDKYKRLRVGRLEATGEATTADVSDVREVPFAEIAAFQ